METKRCSKCGEVKDVGGFYKRNNRKSGYTPECKACAKQYRKENIEKISKREKQYDEKRKEKRAQYYQQNKEYITQQGKQYRDANKPKRRKYYKKYSFTNKEMISERAKNYYQKNKEKIHLYRKTRYKDNPYFRCVEIQRNRRSNALKNIVTTTKKHFHELFCCDKETFLKYISDQFTEGMAWNNQGFYGWHIDHIRPCASFDLTDPEQQKQCFHYTNLQPLWAFDNLSKGDKYKEAI